MRINYEIRYNNEGVETFSEHQSDIFTIYTYQSDEFEKAPTLLNTNAELQQEIELSNAVSEGIRTIQLQIDSFEDDDISIELITGNYRCISASSCPIEIED